MLHRDILREKWRKYAKMWFSLWLALYVAVAIGTTAAILMTPLDLYDYTGNIGIARKVGWVLFWWCVVCPTSPAPISHPPGLPL